MMHNLKYGSVALLAMLIACDKQPPLTSYPNVNLNNTVTISLDSQITPAKYLLTIAFPPDYNNPLNQNQSYPVIYLLDAEYSFNIAYSLTQFLGNREIWQNTIVVGIGYQDNPDNYWPNRRRDYTPVNIETVPGSGEAQEFLQSIKKEIFPLIESQLRINGQRTLVGYSYGGLFATYTALTAPETFNNYVMISPSLWFDDNIIFSLLDSQDALICSHNDIRLIMSIGSEEDEGNYTMVSDLNNFIRKLQTSCQNNIDITELVLVNQHHMTVYPEAFTRAMEALYSLNDEESAAS